METLDGVKLQQQNVLLKANSLERDRVVWEYKQLMEEAGRLQLIINKMEKEVDNEKHKAYPDRDPNYPYSGGDGPVVNPDR